MYKYLHRFFQWLYRRPLGEPRGLYQLFQIGVFLILIGGLSTMLVGFRQGLWDFSGTPKFRNSRRCQAQLENRQFREAELNKRHEISKVRLDELEKALTEPHNPAYIGARAAISIEENVKAIIERDQKALKVETVRDFLPHFLVGFLLVILFALMAARFAGRQGLAAFGAWSRSGGLENWRKPYWSWVVLVFCTHTAREISTSILETENKSWFGWSSFCVSSDAWTLNLVPALGVAMLVAYPATILWHFGRSSNRPIRLDRGHQDGQWGVGSYVLFLQTWAILSLAFLLLPGALWLRAFLDDPRFSPAYLLPSIFLFASVLVISGRMIRNAIVIRRTYLDELKKLGTTWQEIQDKKPPPDPTINFLGEHWWKLPTVIAGMFALLWLIVEQIGVSDLLVKLTSLQ